MFKMGGSAGTGITSGLDKPRQQYNQAGLVDPNKLLPQLGSQKATRNPDDPTTLLPQINKTTQTTNNQEEEKEEKRQKEEEATKAPTPQRNATERW